MHPPGAQVLKYVHPAAKMCTQGAGCNLNFGHGQVNEFNNQNSRNFITPYGRALVKRLYDTGTCTPQKDFPETTQN